MISRMQIDFKKYNADGIGSRPATLPRVASFRRQPWADKSTTPMVLVHVHRFLNKQTKPSMRNSLKRNRRGGACVPARTSAQRRFHTKNRFVHHVLCAGMNDECALAGRHGRAHRHRPYQTPLYIRIQSSPNDINHPNETRKQSTHTSGAEMHRALPPPLLKIKKCVYRYDFGITVDNATCFKTNYSFGVTVASP